MDNDPSRFVTKRGDMKKFNSLEEARAWKQQQMERVEAPAPEASTKKPRKPKTS